jgi:hypothetical protein
MSKFDSLYNSVINEGGPDLSTLARSLPRAEAELSPEVVNNIIDGLVQHYGPNFLDTARQQLEQAGVEFESDEELHHALAKQTLKSMTKNALTQIAQFAKGKK